MYKTWRFGKTAKILSISKSSKKGKVAVSARREKKRGGGGRKKMYGATRCRLTTGSRFAYLCRASFACHLHHHLTSTCSFCARFCVPQNVLFRPFSLEMHRCVRPLHNYYDYREYSSWLVVKKPPLGILSLPSLSFIFDSPPVFVSFPSGSERWKRETRVANYGPFMGSRVCVN